MLKRPYLPWEEKDDSFVVRVHYCRKVWHVTSLKSCRWPIVIIFDSCLPTRFGKSLLNWKLARVCSDSYKEKQAVNHVRQFARNEQQSARKDHFLSYHIYRDFKPKLMLLQQNRFIISLQSTLAAIEHAARIVTMDLSIWR